MTIVRTPTNCAHLDTGHIHWSSLLWERLDPRAEWRNGGSESSLCPPPPSPKRRRFPGLFSCLVSPHRLRGACFLRVLLSCCRTAFLRPVICFCSYLMTCPLLPCLSFCSFNFFEFIYLFLDKGEGREKERERNIDWLLNAPIWGPGPQPRHGS